MRHSDTSSNHDDITKYACLNSHESIQSNTQVKDEDHAFSLKVGSVCLGKYTILKVLQDTQFGFLYLVEKNDADKTKYIIKEFFPRNCVIRGDKDQMLLKLSLTVDTLQNFNFLKKTFRGEAEQLATLSKNPHPNIINLTALENNINNTIYMVLTYEEGIVLNEFLVKRREKGDGRLSSAEIYNLVTPLFDALEHMHDLDIYHQNIKPENIILKKDGTPLLIDFKASVVFYDEDKDQYCNAYTPRYASPEQVTIKTPSQIDQTTDIYAMGVLLYHLLTNSFPVTAYERVKSMVIDEQDDPYVSIFEHVFSIGYENTLLQSIDKALSFSKKDRFQSASDFKNTILGIESSGFLQVFLSKVGTSIQRPIKKVIGYLTKSSRKVFNGLKVERKKVLYVGATAVPILVFFIYFLGGGISGKLDTKVIAQSELVANNNTNIVAPEIKNIDRDVQKKAKTSIQSEIIREQKKTPLPGEDLSPKLTKNDREEKEIDMTQVDEKIDTVAQMKETNQEQAASDKSKLDTFATKEQKPTSKTIKEVTVDINVTLPVNIGETKIKVNGKGLSDHQMIASQDNVYDIGIENPYYRPMHVKRTFDELKEFPEQTFVPILGKGKIYLRGLPENVTIKVFELIENDKKEMSISINNRDGVYEMILQAGTKFYMTFDKKEYRPFKTETYILQHGKALTQTYHLEKKEVADQPKSVVSSIPTVKIDEEKTKTDNTIEKVKKEVVDKPKSVLPSVPKVKINEKKTKTANKIEKVKKKASNKKNKQVKPKVTNKIKKAKKSSKKQRVKKSVEQKIKDKPEVQKKTNKVVPAKKNTSNHIWYCHAKAIGSPKVSASHTSKQMAQNKAMQKCRNKTQGNKRCQILNCFLLRN